MRSASATLLWPAVLPQAAAAVHGYFVQLMRSQRLPGRALERLQALQLAARLEHAARESAHWRELIPAGPIEAGDARRILARLPLLTRADLQEKPDAVFCEVPRAHGAVSEKRTTGSTGQPVMVKCTRTAFDLREAMTLRAYTWFGVDPQNTFAAIRAGLARDKPDGVAMPSWGGTMGRLFDTGKSFGLALDAPSAVQLAWLDRLRPAYLLTYPSNLRVLLAERSQPWPGLKAVMTIGESVPEELREEAKSRWGVPLFDQYSSEELGMIAAQCECGSYHVMAEGLLVEILRDDGSPCAPGEIGRVAVTDLHNFATALLRYELRDYAEAGTPCACGRHLPVLRRIIGRTRNRLTLPDGTKVWPASGLRNFADLPIRQYQLVQLSLEKLELRLHAARPLSAEERSAIAGRVRQSLGSPFEIDVQYFDAPLPAGAGGKFEQFVSRLP